MFIGNSLTYVNNLPSLLGALAAAQPRPLRIETATFVQPGGSLAERLLDGAATTALRSGRWDAVVLQERGALPRCLAHASTRREPDCRDSIRAHRAFAAAARDAGARLILLETWDTTPATPPSLHQGTRRLAGLLGAEVVHAGDALQAHAARRGHAATFADRIHPRLAGSLVIAAQLHRTLTGQPPRAVALHIDFRLLPPEAPVDPQRPLESQAALMHADRPILLPADAVAPLLQLAAGFR